ncbi:MAG: hypothetical protein Q7S61_03610, partial [bacterium]|nr:hypothetical protein [bacterium]
TLREFKTGFMYLLVPTALFCVLFFFPVPLYDIFFTTRYLAAVPIIRALSLPFILYSLSSLPMLFILYTVKKPVYILMANIMFFLIVTAGSYTLIPGMKVLGPPWAIFAAFLVSTTILSIATIKEYRKMK